MLQNIGVIDVRFSVAVLTELNASAAAIKIRGQRLPDAVQAFSDVDEAPFSGAYVTFEPGARSAGHIHPSGQFLGDFGDMRSLKTRTGQFVIARHPFTLTASNGRSSIGRSPGYF